MNLRVSLDGLEAQHDSIRGRSGMYQRVLQLLDDCASEHMPIGVITTIGKDNMNSLRRFHDIIAPRAFVWQVQLAEAMGNQRRQSHPQIDPDGPPAYRPDACAPDSEEQDRIRTADNIGYFGPFESVHPQEPEDSHPCWVGCYGGCRHWAFRPMARSRAASRCRPSRRERERYADVARRDLESSGRVRVQPGLPSRESDRILQSLRTLGICRGGCHFMRACEGGTDNPFCYHRVATLADRKRPRRPDDISLWPSLPRP